MNQIVDDVKTDGSRRPMTLDHELIAILGTWKQNSQFHADQDWMFASPLKLGRLPYSYTGFWRELHRALHGCDEGNPCWRDCGVDHCGSSNQPSPLDPNPILFIRFRPPPT